MLLRQGRCLGSLGAAAYLIVGCGGSGVGGGSSLSGTENVKSFVIPAGQTVTVSGDTTVNATQNIEIDGTLQIPEGVNVSLMTTGPLVVKGSIVEAPTSQEVQKTQLAKRGSPPPLLTLCGNTVSLGNVASAKGTGIDVVSQNNNDITFSSITAGNGIPSKTAGQAGGNAGNIEIGTPTANDAAIAQGYTFAKTPGNVQGGTVFGGNGGVGYNDPGTVNGQNMVATGTAGGAGSNVNIAAQTTVAVQKIQGGAGGRGGSGTTTPSPAVATGVGQAGLNSVVTTGDGGPGGSVSCKPANTGTTQPGPGEAPGDSTATAQGGGADANGGSSTVTCGLQGADGTGGSGTPWSIPGSIPASAYLASSAGSGGDADNNSVIGGSAGSCTVTDTKGNAVSIPKFQIVIKLAKGGKGYSGTCGLSGAEKGTDGGPGASYSTKGAASNNPTGGDGGAGGSGNPYGHGGAAGTNMDSGTPAGKKGADGAPCTTTSSPPTVTSTVQISQSSISFLCYDPGTGQVFGIGQDGGTTIYVLGTQTNTWIPYMVNGQITAGPNGICVSGGTTRGRRSKRGTPLLYAASYLSNAVLVINESTGSQLASIPMPSGIQGPTAVAFDATSGRLYAAGQTSNGAQDSIVVFDTTNNNAVIGSITVTGPPYALALNPSTNRLYASDILKDFDVVDTKQMKQVSTQVLPDVAYTLAVNPNNGVVFADQYYTSKVVVIDPSSNSITNTLTAGTSPWGMEVDSQRNRLYVANYNYASSNQQPGSLTEIDTNTYQTLFTVQLGLGPTNLAVNESADQIYVADALDSSIVILNGN